MAIDLATAQSHLDAWLDADLALATNETYTISTPSGSRSLTRANGDEVRAQIALWEARVTRLSAGRGGGIRVRNVVPV